MTKSEIKNPIPLLRAGFLSLLLLLFSVYIGYRMSGMLSGVRFSPADPFAEGTSVYDFVSAWIRLVSPALIGHLLIFASAFSPFCTAVSAAVVLRCGFSCGLAVAFLSPGSVPLFAAEMCSALGTVMLSGLSLGSSSFLRRVEFRRADPVIGRAAKYASEFFCISGGVYFIYLISAIIAHIL